MKITKILLSTALLLSFFTGTALASFSDVDYTTKVGEAITKMTDKGIISGFDDGLFHPNESLTRAQAVKIINKIFGYTLPGAVSFSDVKEGDWFYTDVAAAVNAGYIKGFPDGTFCPDGTLTKEQVCVMLDNIMNFVMLPSDIKISDNVSDWAKESVEKILSNCLASVDENGNFHATENISRGDFCALLSQFVLDILPEIEPFDINSIAKEELNVRLERIITAIREVLINKTDSEQIRAVFNKIADNMEAFVNDPSHDYEAGAKEAKGIYSALPSDLRSKTKDLLVNFFTDDKYADDINILYSFFF